MGVGKGNVELVNVDHLFLLFIYAYTTRGSTAAAIPVFPLKIDSDSLPVPHATLEFFFVDPSNHFACPTGIAHN